MQIKKLIVDNHLCLVDFSINFEINDSGSSTILIGENGTGKSTMIETILQILMSFDSAAIEKKIDYSYELTYQFAGQIITIYQSDRFYQVHVGHELVGSGRWGTVKNHLNLKGRRILPERINYFYSGLNNKVAGLFRTIEQDYEGKCRDELKRYWNELYLANHTYENYFFPKRKYFQCAEESVPIYLAALLCGQESFEKTYIQTHCNIQNIQTIMVELDVRRLPIGIMQDVLDMGENGKEGIFQVVEFIDHRFEPLFRNGFIIEFGGKYQFEIEHLSEIDVAANEIYDFFEKLSVFFSLKLKVYISVGNSRVDVDYLSEGQRQIVKVLGLLGLCKSEDTLVLMDEPDTHMNPRWKYELKSMIDLSLEDAINTQAIIATHDPLVINGVPKEYIRLFEFNSHIAEDSRFYFTKVIEPTEDTVGMGIDGLLQSEYYGLRTSYDNQADSDIRERQRLYIKLISNEATPEDKEQLVDLTKKIGSFHISHNTIDFLYDDFLSIYRESEFYLEDYLRPDEIALRRERMKEIIEELFRNKQ